MSQKLRGRNFIIGGRSALCAWPTPAPTVIEWDVCSGTDQDLEIEDAEIVINNLNFQGPDLDADEAVLRYHDVVRNAPGGQQIDLIVSVAPNSDYLLAEPSSNGKWEQFAQINVRDNEPTTLRFQFVDSDTDEPVELTRFVISVFDIDEQIDSTIQSEQV